MKNNLKTRGFTLVELAIVITIIGLLIAGVLKGQELIMQGRITAMVTQINGYRAAMIGFQDIYDAVPGDMIGASRRLPACNANCEPRVWGSWGDPDSNGGGGAGNRRVESDWYPQAMPNPPNSPRDEATLFWVHLLKANLITGVTDAAIRTDNLTPQWDVTLPSTRRGGGLMINYYAILLDGNLTVPGTWAYLMLTPDATGQYNNPSVVGTNYVAQLDRKMDDGMPHTGSVVSMDWEAGTTGTNCALNPTSVSSAYAENVTIPVCRVQFRLDGT